MTSQIKTTELPIAFDADFDSSDFVLILDDGITKRLPRQDMIDNFLPFMQGEKGDTGATGIKGDKGDKGDTGLTGAAGAQGIQGIQGVAGATGAQGQKGWSPILAVVSDGTRRVLQVSDWTGGAGTKPASGSYIGATNLVTAIGDAIDIRGATGATGSTGATGASGTNGTNGTDGLDARQISTITHEANNAITTTFTDTTFVTSDAPKRLLGWASYQDTIYTSGSPLTLSDGIRTTLQNNSGTVINTYIPFGVTAFYNNGSNKITPAAVGDGYSISVRFTAVPSAVNTYLSFGIDIGTGADIFQKTEVLPRGAGTPNPVSIDVQGFALSNFLANGGLVKLTAVGGNVQVYGVEFQIHRTSVA